MATLKRKKRSASPSKTPAMRIPRTRSTTRASTRFPVYDPARPAPAFLPGCHAIIHNPSIIRNIYDFLPSSDRCTLLRVDQTLYELVGRLVYRHLTVDWQQIPLSGLDRMEKKATKKRASVHNTKRRLISFTQYLSVRLSWHGVDVYSGHSFDNWAAKHDNLLTSIFSVRSTDLSKINTLILEGADVSDLARILMWRRNSWSPSRIIFLDLNSNIYHSSRDSSLFKHFPLSVRHVVIDISRLRIWRIDHAGLDIVESLIAATQITRLTFVFGSDRANVCVQPVVQLLNNSDKVVDVIYYAEHPSRGITPDGDDHIARDLPWMRGLLRDEAVRIGWEDEEAKRKIEDLVITPGHEVSGEEWHRYIRRSE